MASCRSSTGASLTCNDSVLSSLISRVPPFGDVKVVAASAVRVMEPFALGARRETRNVEVSALSRLGRVQLITPPDSAPPSDALTKVASVGTLRVTVVEPAAIEPTLATSTITLNSSPKPTTAAGKVSIATARSGKASTSVVTEPMLSLDSDSLSAEADNVAVSVLLASVAASTLTRIVSFWVVPGERSPDQAQLVPAQLSGLPSKAKLTSPSKLSVTCPFWDCDSPEFVTLKAYSMTSPGAT